MIKSLIEKTLFEQGHTIKRVALIEDDKVFLTLMHDFFEKKGCVCEDFGDVASVLKNSDKSDFDLYIIDINLPGDKNGIELLKELRRKDPNVPVIMVSGNTDIETVMDAYESGCDEYLKKPFDLRELEIKVSKLLTSHLIALSENVTYDVDGRILFVDEKEVHLSQKESNLLHMFMTNINRALTHEYLEKEIWGVDDDNGHALRNLVLRLRKRIGKGIIDTVQGKGYILRLK